MTDRPKSYREAQIDAVRWFVRAQSGEMDAVERRAFEDWRLLNRANEHELDALQHIWDTAREIPTERFRALATDRPESVPGARPQEKVWRRPFAYAATLVLVIAAVYAGQAWYRAVPTFTARLETTRGEHKRITLPDYSMIEMNVSSRGTASYYKDRREVTIASGEMLFTVLGNAARPFMIDAGSGRIIVVGTRFNVRRDGDEVSVSVAEGTVEVLGRGASSPVRLSAGLSGRVDAAGQVQEAKPVDPAAVAAWRDGKLVFDDATLAEVVREVMRYRERPILIPDTRIAQLRLSSIFNINDTDALLSALPKILPVRVIAQPDGSTVISGRGR
jgi:transmembrane sensor